MTECTFNRWLIVVVIAASIGIWFMLRGAVREGWPDAQRIEVAR